MIIEINRPNDPTTFDKIKEGDAFLFSSILYVKIVPATHNYCQSANALNLVSYVLFFFRGDDTVTPVKAKLTIE